MMRVTPLAVWASGLLGPGRIPNTKDFFRVIASDSSFTHPSGNVQVAIAAYAAAIAHLVQNPNSSDRVNGALTIAKALLTSQDARKWFELAE